MSRPRPTRMRRLAATSAFATALLFGAGTAAAQDQHSGGVSPNEATRDQGSAVAGDTVLRGDTASRSGGLPITGSDAAGIAGIGAAAVAVGAGVVAASKRRAHLAH